MKRFIQQINIFLLSLIFIVAGCSDSGNNGSEAVEAELAEDIPGNVNTLTQNRAPVADINEYPDENRYTFYDLDSDKIITDSTSAEWDIAFNGTTILANSGNNGGIRVVEGSFEEVKEAPTSGYEASNKEWYDYTGFAPNGPQHAIFPKEDTTIVVKTPEGRYAKVQILSYYEGDPDTSTEEFANLQTRPADGYFTFNYVLQNAESTQLFNEDSFTLFDLETGEIVTDTLSPQWDLKFSATTIIANTANDGGIQSLNIPFEDVDEAPTSGYAEGDSDWYTYAMSQHAVLVNDGVTLLVRTPEGNYAKVRMLSYYKGNPDTSSDEFINQQTRPAERYFSFEYAVQENGSVNFE